MKKAVIESLEITKGFKEIKDVNAFNFVVKAWYEIRVAEHNVYDLNLQKDGPKLFFSVRFKIDNSYMYGYSQGYTTRSTMKRAIVKKILKHIQNYDC